MTAARSNIWVNVFLGALMFLIGTLALNKCETEPLVDANGRLHGGVLAH